ncbi:sigma-E factor negative regulatory protein [Massilia sp. ST3]|uniref:sigma-E factor negative regulatory protein n=1 Tax=Massilia sp. ST3 TaxID=2824903 RepID=UPI001B83ED75|nr:sigma-E factor negative regulatory protein [Massilia sp. ST3]MBQ5947437.1 sigma-E factor negative regulatory protein [Massilia sp. ST3]
MDTDKKIREHISALGDGELPEADVELAVAALHEPGGREAWDLYHRIGDVLRAQPVPDLSPAFSARLASRLADEPMPVKRAVAAGDATEAISAPVLSNPASS